MPEWVLALAFVAVALSFLVSAAAGMGGSLILVPAMALLLGPKEGVAVAALLLGCNNLFKLLAYRRTIPWRESAAVVLVTVVGASIGASLLLAVPERWVDLGIVAALLATLLIDCSENPFLRRTRAGTLAFAAGAASGFSGTSGPLKGIALRSFGFDRFHLLGAASTVSLAGDISKAAVFAVGDLFDHTAWIIILGALPIMPAATFSGRFVNQQIGERAYAMLFWTVMAGYSIRLAVV